MRIFLLWIVLMCLTVPVFGQKDESVVDSGKLLAFLGGKQIGSETFTIRQNGVGEGQGSLTIHEQTINLKSRTEYSGTHPAAFELEYGPGQKLQLSIEGAAVKLAGAQQPGAQTDPDAVILENNVGYQFYFLVRRYDKTRGGTQQFKMFVPTLMQTLPISLELKGAINSPADKSVKLEHYRALIAGMIGVDVVTDKSGRLVFMAVPSQKAETVREEYAPSLDGLRAAVSSAPKTAEVDYSAPPLAPFTAEEVTINAKGFTLAGTLLLPKSGARPFPAVITITGSGQQTRDEPVPVSGLEDYRPMRQIAETLASRGIAVLRVDDRGVGGSKGLETLETATTSDFADDVRAEVAYLRSRSEIDARRIALVGHSEGGLIAPMVAATDKQLAAVVLMAGTAKTGAQISTDQLNDVLERSTSMTEEEKSRKRAEQAEMIRAVQTGADLSKYPKEVRLPWVREFWTYDPLVTIRKVRQPILILQGALDRQVTAEQAAMLERAAREAGNKDVTARLFPALNHLFLPAKTGAFDEYTSLATSRIGDDVLRTLADWLETKLKVGKYVNRKRVTGDK